MKALFFILGCIPSILLSQTISSTDPAGVEVTFTVYQALSYQTDNRPTETASGYIIQDVDNALSEGIAAVSRDLLRDYPYGSKIQIECMCPYNLRVFRVEDTMNSRYTKTVDILIGLNDTIGKWEGRITRIF